MAFPCNQFADQEPGDNEEIIKTARGKFGAEFPILEKCDVNGSNCNEVWKYLRAKSELYDEKKKRAKEIPWNFAKFMVAADGTVLKYFNPRVDPVSTIGFIEGYLNSATVQTVS